MNIALRIRWGRPMHIGAAPGHSSWSIWRDDSLGVEKWVETPRISEFEWGESKDPVYYIDGDEEWEYESEWELLHYLKNEKHLGKTPRLQHKVVTSGRKHEIEEKWVWE